MLLDANRYAVEPGEFWQGAKPLNTRATLLFQTKTKSFVRLSRRMTNYNAERRGSFSAAITFPLAAGDS